MANWCGILIVLLFRAALEFQNSSGRKVLFGDDLHHPQRLFKEKYSAYVPQKLFQRKGGGRCLIVNIFNILNLFNQKISTFCGYGGIWAHCMNPVVGTGWGA